MLQLLERGEIVDRGQPLGQPHRLGAVHLHRFPPSQARGEHPQVGAQPVHLEGEIDIIEQALSQLHQLGALLGRQRGHEPAEGRCPRGQRLQQLIEVSRSLGEELAVTAHEIVELLLSGLVPGCPPLEHGVEIGHHVLEPGHLLGVRVAHRLGHAAHVAVQHLPADFLEQLGERLLGLGGGEFVTAQFVDLGRRAVGESIEQHLGKPGVVVVAIGQRFALQSLYLFQPLAELLQGVGDPPPPLLFTPELLEPLSQLLEPTEPPGQPFLEEPAERPLGVPSLEEVLVETANRLVDRYVGAERVLGAVPACVPVGHDTASPDAGERRGRSVLRAPRGHPP